MVLAQLLCKVLQTSLELCTTTAQLLCTNHSSIKIDKENSALSYYTWYIVLQVYDIAHLFRKIDI